MEVSEPQNLCEPELSLQLELASTGACSCQTKTPDPDYHAVECLYRTLQRAVSALEGKDNRITTQSAELDALRGEVERLDTTPWKDFHGDLPDYDHPLRCVYESGIQYAVNLLAATLKVDDWEICDGTEEFDGDLGGTLFSIFLAALPTDQHGDPMYPSEIAATIAQLRDRVAGLEEGVSDLLPRGVCWDNPNIPDDTVLPIDMTMGEIRKARALLTQNEVG